MKLSILIRSIESRREKLSTLYMKLQSQIIAGNFYNDVEILVEIDNKQITSGAKANILLNRANGKYIAFIDDDDDVSDCYISEIIRLSHYDFDCMATNGTYSMDGKGSTKWFLSKDNQDHDTYIEGELVFMRRTNHISPVKRELALKAMFPDKSNAEDKEYSERLHPHLKTEIKINPPMYHYRYSSINKEYV